MEISEGTFERLAVQTLAEIETALETAGIDVERGAGGVLEVDFDDGSQMIINAHRAAREIWVAARAGGFHYRHDGTQWIDTRGSEGLWPALSRLVSQQSGDTVTLP
jgi:CyaY protein